MSGAEDDVDAALLALGGCTAEEHARLREKLKRDRDFGDQVENWEMLLAPLASFVPEVAAPDGLLGRIESRLTARQRLEALSRTLRANEGEWIRVSPGLRLKLLNNQPDRRTVLLDVEPGACYAAHEHLGDEEIYMISGDLTIGDVELGAGDYHFSPKGSRHPDATSRAGCRCIVSVAAG
jgi:hypothetical protein